LVGAHPDLRAPLPLATAVRPAAAVTTAGQPPGEPWRSTRL